MNIWKLTIFLAAIFGMIQILGVSNIPVACDSSYNSCVYFSYELMSSATIEDVVTGNIDEGQYQQINIFENITPDIYVATASAITRAVQFLVFMLVGIAQVVIFFLGRNAVAYSIAAFLQSIIYFFYGKEIYDRIKVGSGEI